MPNSTNQLNLAEQQQLLALGHYSVGLLIDRAQSDSGWKTVETSSKGVVIQQHIDTSSLQQQQQEVANLFYFPSCDAPFYKSWTEVAANVDEVEELFLAEQMGVTGRHLCDHRQDNTMMRTLYTLPTENDEDVVMTIKHFEMLASHKLLAAREMCMLEVRQHFYTKEKQQRAFAVSYTSVEVPFCPSSAHVLRSITYNTGYVFIETGRRKKKAGSVRAFFLAQSDPKGQIPLWLKKLAAKKRCKHLAELSDFVQKNRLSKQRFISDMSLQATDRVKDCYLCERKIQRFFFQTQKKKLSCRLCGNVRVHIYEKEIPFLVE